MNLHTCCPSHHEKNNSTMKLAAENSSKWQGELPCLLRPFRACHGRHWQAEMLKNMLALSGRH